MTKVQNQAILFKNAKIYDGSGAEPFTGSVLVENDRIVQAGTDVAALDRRMQAIHDKIEALSAKAAMEDHA